MGFTVVMVISALYPDRLNFPFEFERGQIWRYEDLRAPYDIPVLKSNDALLADMEQVQENATPVYEYRPEVARRAREQFIREFATALDSARVRQDNLDLLRQPDSHRRYGLRVLDKLYSQGIINAREEDEMNGMATVVTTINGSQQQEKTIAQFYTPGDAVQWLEDSLFFTDLQSPEFLLNLLDNKFQHNVFYNDSLTVRLRTLARQRVSRYDGLVSESELMIGQGDRVTDQIFQKLASYRTVYQSNMKTQTSFWSVFGGFAIQIAIVIILLFWYLRRYFPRVYSRPGNLLLLLLWPVLYAVLVRAVDGVPEISAWVIPFCIVPIVVRIFFTERLGLFVHVIVVLIASFLTSLGFTFTFLSIMAGVVVIVTDVDTRDMTKYFRSLSVLFLFYCVGYIGLELLRGGTWRTVNYVTIGWLAGNVFLVLLAYPLIPLIGKIFGFISPITLMELSDMNQPLLQRLARQASGTWQHSLNVANMAEQATRAVGGNALLVKTAALYHDIGKIENPGYFIENQNGPNPHHKIGPKESAAIIINHVADGTKLARKAGLPEVIIDFIRTHHGTTRAEYFYLTYVKDHPEREAEEATFRYPGPRPSTKEQTILMIADSVEAACKSLKSPSEEELYAFIDQIIQGKVTSGQLKKSGLTFKELEVCRMTFKSIMKSVYNVRIAYPDKQEEE
ncbi:HD family phosphohydrolase [Neolewinella antarctica]|uniref:HD/PDEase domain-containing protein n=1 Tax=Neolewinella antarctica TaxID=442734 RepID=A0ABX0X7N9_9BACT|nr:HDIG domain-containing metalloprotein [Neolewinella antarctica]NJC25162.1 hypothetical protein [Neolewinella antarctica]